MARYLLFYKPFHVLCQFTPGTTPPKGETEPRRTLKEFIDVPNVYPAGRLDWDSEGLLLLTDDGALIHKLLNPNFAHPRTYWAQVERVPDEAALNTLETGVTIQGKRTRPAQAHLLDPPPTLPERHPPIRFRKAIPTAWLSLTLVEGRNRQVRRMTAAVGFPTLRLVRWATGPLTLGSMEPGECRELTAVELDDLRSLVNASNSAPSQGARKQRSRNRPRPVRGNRPRRSP
ncbi:MAG: pseudouridine synthase [Cyanobacteria bacterium P01_C01_bin.89]